MVWVVPWPHLRYGLSFVLLWLLPGLSWTSLVPPDALDRVERVVVGLGLSFVVTPAVTLLTAYIPGPLTRAALLAATAGSVGLPLALSALMRLMRRPAAAFQEDRGRIRKPGKEGRASLLSTRRLLWRDGWVWLLVAILIAVALRTIHLGYSEFQGDEAAVMMRAARALEGDEAIVFQHKKGPTELALVMASWRLTGVTSEWMARLPFAWASVLGVIAVFLCGRRFGRPHAGGLAACLLGIEGYLVGFGRIVQYQSLVFALNVLGLHCLLAYHARGRGSLLIAAALLAGGSLAHYDAVLALPAGLLLVGGRLWRDRGRIWRALGPVGAAALVGIALMGIFYLPFLRSSHVGSTSSYLSARLGGAGGFYNHLRPTFERSAVYDAIYFLALVGLAFAIQVLITWRRWGWMGLGSSAILAAAALSGLAWPKLWAADDLTLAWIPAAFLLTGSLLAPAQSLETRAVWLWLGVPALFYLYFVALPLTHIYTALPALALLGGMGIAALGRWLAGRSKTALRVAGAVGAAAYVLSGFYTAMMFVDHTPEYLRTFPQSKHPLYWTPYEEIPEEGLFGFPYRAGWKVVGHLMDTGALSGTYDSNEEGTITDYYTRRAIRLDCASPDMYVIAENVQDEVPVRWDQIEAEYQRTVVVTVAGQPKLTVYERDAITSPQVHRAAAHDRTFTLDTTPERVAMPAAERMTSAPAEEFVSHEALVGDFAQLLGYRLDTRHAVPGGYVELTLLWQARGPAGGEGSSQVKVSPIDYQVFTHLHDGERMRGQLDGEPVCGNRPTSQWRSGELIVDPYRIPIKVDAPLGLVPLTVGMYNLATMQRLPVSEPAGDSVHLTDVEIRAP